MAPYYVKPENALKRAEELINVNQSAVALTLLQEILSSKRHRNVAMNIIEPIAVKFIELCVDLTKGKAAKEGLYAFKNFALNTSILSIENVIRKFLELAEAKLTSAQAKVRTMDCEVEDLESLETPESILLSTLVSQDDQTDREHVLPALRFLWEAYRASLDALRNNDRLETLYQQVATSAFTFCIKNNRKTEFRRLCDVLRQHLVSAAKYPGQLNAINLNDPDTLARLVETRFAQLCAAVELEHWQEGFKSIEDIFTLLESLNKTPKASWMATYYEKMAKIFMVGENHLFHAAAAAKYYALMKDSKVLSPEEHAKFASIVFIAALAIPTEAETEETQAKKQRLLSYMRMKTIPTRESLIKDALSKGVYKYVNQDLKDLYEILEVQFHPLSICQKLAPLVEKLNQEGSDFKEYLKPLHSVFLSRLLQQLSQVYSTVRIEFIVKLASFPQPFAYDRYQIEKFVMNQCERGELNIRINHATGTLVFQNLLAGMKSTQDGAKISQGQQLQHQLSLFAERLHAIANSVDPNVKKSHAETRKKAFADAAEQANQDRIDTYMRRAFIEKKKVKREQELAKKEKEEARIKEARLLAEAEAHKIKVAEDAKRREQERILAHRATIEKQEAQKIAEQLLTGKGVKKEDLESLDTAKLKELQIEQLEKERKDLQVKSKTLMKRLDHIERAYRREEIPLVNADYVNQQKADQEAYEVSTKSRTEDAKIRHTESLLLKKRVSKLFDDYKVYKSELVAKETKTYQTAKAEADKKLAIAKEARIKKVTEERQIAKEREEARRAQEAADRIKEDAKRALLEKEKAEKAERDAKLEESARKQREREAEIEARLSSKSSLHDRSPDTPSTPSTPSLPSTGGYVPPALRKKMEESASSLAGSAGGSSDRSSIASRDGEGGWRSARPDSNRAPDSRGYSDRAPDSRGYSDRAPDSRDSRGYSDSNRFERREMPSSFSSIRRPGDSRDSIDRRDGDRKEGSNSSINGPSGESRGPPKIIGAGKWREKLKEKESQQQ